MLNCLRCKHQWEEKPIGHKPKRCPKCQSTSWDKPYKWIKNPDAPISIGPAKENLPDESDGDISW